MADKTRREVDTACTTGTRPPRGEAARVE